jgi:glucarate dehydratase
MKITDMCVTPIAISDPPIRNSIGIHAPYALRTIVELIDDHGVSGISEVPGDLDTTQALEEAREYVVGADPYHITRLLGVLARRFGGRGTTDRGVNPWDKRTYVHVASAVEVACLDLIGKTVGRPICDLLGGAVRTRIPFASYLFFKPEGAGGALGFGIDPKAVGWPAVRQRAAATPDDIVRQARAMVEAFGFQAHKLKGGVMEPDVEVCTVLALREAFGPGIPLRIDPNGVWSVETAIACGKRLTGVLEYYEDPVRGQEDMAKVGKVLGIPMATNMYTTSFEDIPRSIELGAESIILSDHHFWGGLRSSLDLAAVCRTFGRGLSMHSNSHLGISLMAMAHLAAAVPNLDFSLDTHYPWQSEEVVVGGPIEFDGGVVRVGNAPGLGVELDHEALAHLHDNYTSSGLTIRDDAAEMRKLDPKWEAKLTRW